MVSELSREEVRNYIIEKRGEATKNDVASHMSELKDISLRTSRVTTLKIIDDFESNGIIIVQKTGRKGTSHFLAINEANAFNLIDKWVHEAEVIGKFVQKNLDTISPLYDKPSSSEYKEIDELSKYFHIAKDFVILMIHTLLSEIYNRIISNDDKLTLTLKAVKVIIKTLKGTEIPTPPISLGQLFSYSASISESAILYGNNVEIQIEDTTIVKKLEEFEKDISALKNPQP